MAATSPTNVQWYSLSEAQAAQELCVNVKEGLTAADATNRLHQYVPNRLAEKQK